MGRGISPRKGPPLELLRLRKPGREEPGKRCPSGSRPPPQASPGPGRGRSRITTKGAGGRPSCGGHLPGRGWVRGGVCRPTSVKSTGKSVKERLQPAASSTWVPLPSAAGEVGSPPLLGKGAQRRRARKGPPWKAGPGPASAGACCQVRALPAPPLRTAVGREAGASWWGFQGPLPAELPLGHAAGSPDLGGGHLERRLLARSDARTCRLTGASSHSGGPLQPHLSLSLASFAAGAPRGSGRCVPGLLGGSCDPAGRSPSWLCAR